MLKSEFNNLRMGDTVVITNHGRNKGKMGIVKNIVRHDVNEGTIYIEPIDCDFSFTNSYRKPNKEGLYSWSRQSIGLLKKPHNKKFYVEQMFGEDSVSWSADNFTLDDLLIIDRFLNKFNEKADGLTIDSVAILNDNED